MKKKIRFIFFLLLLDVFFLNACGSRADIPDYKDTAAKESELFFASEAFSELEAANEIVESASKDIYDAWHWSILGDGKKTCTLPLLAKEIGKSENELKRGFAYISNQETWAELSIGDRQKLINRSAEDFSKLISSGYSRFSACVYSVIGCYYENGGFDEAERHFLSAAQLMRSLQEQYPDSVYYESLKAYYSNITAFAAYCREPTGSYEQAKLTINEYRNTVRTLSEELELLLETKR